MKFRKSKWNWYPTLSSRNDMANVVSDKRFVTVQQVKNITPLTTNMTATWRRLLSLIAINVPFPSMFIFKSLRTLLMIFTYIVKFTTSADVHIRNQTRLKTLSQIPVGGWHVCISWTICLPDGSDQVRQTLFIIPKNGANKPPNTNPHNQIPIISRLVRVSPFISRCLSGEQIARYLSNETSVMKPVDALNANPIPKENTWQNSGWRLDLSSRILYDDIFNETIDCRMLRDKNNMSAHAKWLK